MLHRVRVLFVAYLFPPVGGAGVQRVTKLVRYLPAHGMTPIVLTASNPSVPIRDGSLLAEIGSDIRVVRVPTLEPGYGLKRALGGHASRARDANTSRIRRYFASAASQLLFPDPQLLWLPSAALAISRLSRERPGIDAVVISAPPFSQFLLVPWIQKMMKAPILVDYRDEWNTTLRAGRDVPAGAIAARTARRIEEMILARVDAVAAATEEFRTSLLDRMDGLDPGRVHFLPNGWDRDDLPSEEGEPPRDRFRISYAGTVLKLTSLRSVVNALRILHRERPDLAACVELVVHGRVVESERAVFAGAERLGVSLRGYVEHRRALQELTRSHLNLCVLEDVEGAERIYPAKVFELMALRRRTLVVTPPGALERLAKKHCIGDVVAPSEPELIARILERYVLAWQAGTYDAKTEPVDVGRFERKALAGDLAAILRRIGAKTTARDPSERTVHAAESRAL